MVSSTGKPRPTNWPRTLPYLTAPVLSPALSSRRAPSAAIAALNLHGAACACAASPSPLVRIRPITAPSHPACGQSGLFAARTLPARSWVVDYLGVYHTQDESDPASDYDIVLDRDSGVAVDAATCGNEARFVNDYRGVADRANVEFRDRRADGRQARIAIYVGARDVRKGQELLVSYGKGFWDARSA